MMPLEKRILNKLLDTYENSKLSRGENKVAIHIAYPFQKKNIPEYFDESSMVYEEIHAMVFQLKAKGFISIEWKNKRVGHIIQKVILREEAIPEVYGYMNRIPRIDVQAAALGWIEKILETDLAPVTRSFFIRMSERIQAGLSVKEYLDIENAKEMELLAQALECTLKNEEECFVREFSIDHFHDSKSFGVLIPKVCRIIREENKEYENLENEEILSEYQIYRTPSYVYVKGKVQLGLKSQWVDVNVFPDGLGFALNNRNLDHIQIRAVEPVKSVYTIENLTTFFRFARKNSLIIYLGGYHNHVRRELLKKIYAAFPQAEYYHFGDIDAGGFQIFYHLKEKTGIPFSTYGMDLETLKQYEKYGKKLTKNDRKRLEKLRDTKMNKEEQKCVAYMLGNNVKLEQECLSKKGLLDRKFPQ